MTQDNTKQVRRRRRYSAQFKAELVAEYLAGGVSLASLAISHDINPNILHRWVREHKRQGQLTWQVKMAFMPRFIGPRRKALNWQSLSVSY